MSNTSARAKLREDQQNQRRRDRRIIAIVAAAIVLVVIAAGVGFQLWRTNQQPSAGPSPTGSPTPAQLVNGQPVVFGSPSAPVSIELYEDFHCPHCADFEEEFGPTLTAVQDAGRLRVAVYPMSFIDEGSGRAANAMACATEAGFGHRYYRGLFANSTLGWSEAQLLQLAELSTDQVPESFRSCVVGGERTAWADAIDATADADGVTGTPTVFLDGAPLPLAGLTPESLQTMIDAKG